MVCAIDTETTGFRPRYHEIWQVAVVPLDSDFEPLRGVNPFAMEMCPDHPERADLDAFGIGKGDLGRLVRTAMASDRVAELFDEWFNQLPLPIGKKIIPLGCNWPFDRAFIAEWLGWEHMNHYFHGHSRDIQTAALFLNDRAMTHAEKMPCPQVGLKQFCATLGVRNPSPHDALADAVATAACYRKLCHRGIL